MEITLVLNGVELVAAVDSAEAVVLAVAMGELNREAFTKWVKAHPLPAREEAGSLQPADSTGQTRDATAARPCRFFSKRTRGWGCTQGRGPLQWHLENVEATITG